MPQKLKTDTTKETPTPKTEGKLLLRRVDSTTAIMSKDEWLEPVPETVEEKLEKGFTRIDESTVIMLKKKPGKSKEAEKPKAPAKATGTK